MLPEPTLWYEVFSPEATAKQRSLYRIFLEERKTNPTDAADYYQPSAADIRK